MDQLKVLSAGRRVARYEADGKTEIFIWFKAEGRSGSLYWCDPLHLQESAERRMPLDQLTDVMIGKQSALFKSAAGQAANEQGAFTLISKGHTLDLEEESSAMRKALLEVHSCNLLAPYHRI